MRILRSILTLSPLKISAGYFVFGVIWIPSTDVVLATSFQSQQMPTFLGVLKGWIFIGLSTLLIYSLSSVHHQQMKTTQTRLETANQQLQVLQRVFRHNIRNDLNVIHGYVGIVADSVSDTRLQSHLETVQQTTEQITDVSEKLKIVENVDPTLSDSQAVDLVELVNAEIATVRSSNPDLTLTAELPDHAWVEGDESIQYAIHEVVDNAIAHTDKPISECAVSFLIERDDDEFVLEVSDNGSGIPREELRALHTQEETPLVHASSVGLWLVTWLTRIHNGSVEFTAENGTIVTFRFQAELQVPLFDADRQMIAN